MSVKIGVRLGRAVQLNGSNEFLHKADGDISSANAFDIGAASKLTIGGFFLVGQGFLGKRMAMISKRNSSTDTPVPDTEAGYILEKTANDTVRLFLDDGAGNKVSLESTEKLDDDGFYHVVVATIDMVADTAELWMSISRDHRIITKVATSSIGLLGSLANSINFAIGAVYNGTTSSIHWRGACGWAAFWEQVLPDGMVEVLGRFQFPPPTDRRIVSLWAFTERNADDWNRFNQNDLIQTGIDESNYIPGPDRFVIQNTISTTPSMGEEAGDANMVFRRFRPAVLQEGHFFQAGASGAPPLRIRRTTKGAADEPFFTFLEAHTSIYGRYASMFHRLANGTDVWRLYDTDVFETGDNPTGIERWEPLGKISGDPDFRNSREMWDADKDGQPDFLYGFAAGPTAGSTEKFLIIDVKDPTSPSKAGTLSMPGFDAMQVLLDARGNNFCWLLSGSNSTLASIDVSTPTAPALRGNVSDVRIAGPWIVQIGTRIYALGNRGLTVCDITTPTAPSVVKQVQTDPVGGNDDVMVAIVLLPDGNIATWGIDGIGGTAGVVHVWDLADPDDPKLVLRRVEPTVVQPFKAARRGTVVWMYSQPSGLSHLHVYSAAEPKALPRVADYDLSAYDRRLTGADTHVAWDRDRILFYHTGGTIGKQFGFFKYDSGLGQVAVDVDITIPDAVLTNPVPAFEHEKLFHDLSDWDFETDIPGTTPPTGWTKKGGASSDPTVSNDFGLTGQPPGSPTPPQSCKLELVGADTQTGISASMTPAAADMVADKVYPISFWYYVDGEGTFDPINDLVVTVQEEGGAQASVNRSKAGSHADKNRWHRLEFLYTMEQPDRTTFRVDINLFNANNVKVYIDSVRFGPGEVQPLFAGRLMRVEGSREEPSGRAMEYNASFLDHTFDLNRLDVTGSLPAQSAKTSIESLITNNSRSKDKFTTKNVHPELASHDAIEFEGDENLAEAISRVIEQGLGMWWLQNRDIHAMPAGFAVAPAPINDVSFGWYELVDAEDGAEIVTEGTVRGNQALSDRPKVNWMDATAQSRYGQIKYLLDPDADVKSATQAGNLRDFYRQLLAHTQVEGSFKFNNEPRFRPGQIIPVQVEERGLDLRAQIKNVSYEVGDGGRLVATVRYSLLQQDFLDLILPDRVNRANQKGKRQVPEDVGPMTAWMP